MSESKNTYAAGRTLSELNDGEVTYLHHRRAAQLVASKAFMPHLINVERRAEAAWWHVQRELDAERADDKCALEDAKLIEATFARLAGKR